MNEFLRWEGIDAYALCPFEGVPLRLERKLSAVCREWGSKPQWVLVFLAPYYVQEEKGNLSLYARSRDYHLYFEGVFSRLEQYLRQRERYVPFVGFCDNSPADEVELAARCGLGVKGDNGLLIHPRYGSYVFIGEIFFKQRPDLPVTALREPMGCDHCGACRRACPVGEKKELCLSGLSQKKRLQPEEEALLRIHRVVWGCDRCQLVCPRNRGIAPTPLSFFWQSRLSDLTKDGLLELQENDLFQERAFAWRGIDVLFRNLSLTL